MLAQSALETIGDTPLVERASVRPAGGARVPVKWEGGNPTGSTKDRMARQLASEAGLFAGTSSGLNVAAARRVAERRGPDGAVVAVAVDTGLKYLQGDLLR